MPQGGIMLITSIRLITPVLMTAILRANGTLQDHESVSDVRRLASSESDTAAHYQLGLQYKDYRTQRHAPDEVFLKITHVDFPDAEREVRFYSEIAPRMRRRYSSDELCLPQCYDAYYEETSKQAHVILDNLSRAFKPAPQHFPPTARHQQQVIDALARIHAYWWDHPELETFAPVPDRAGLDAEVEMLDRKYAELRSFAGAQLRPRQQDILKLITSGMPLQRQERVLSGTGLTLVHRDLQPANLFYSHRETRILGWRGFAADFGTDDLAYMIACHWSPFERKMHEKNALGRYHETLVRSGVQDYSTEALEQDYRSSIARCIALLLAGWTREKHTKGYWRTAETAIQIFDECNGMEIYG
jgi:hypothetical protein